VLLLLGLAAGGLGGLLGIGGSIVMIPGMAVLLGSNQHLYQAAAMIVNVAVAAPAAWRHWRAGAVRMDVLAAMLPAAIVFIIIGVAASDRIESAWLERIFGVFLVYVIVVNIARLVTKKPEPADRTDGVSRVRAGAVGSITGFMAGLLGVGGGVVTVPLLQRFVHLPLRQCIATSSAVMVLTATVGAVQKNWTLSHHINEQAPGVMLQVTDSLLIAGLLIPTAIIGGVLGAGLTHRMPLTWLRIVFIALLCAAAVRMLGR